MAMTSGGNPERYAEPGSHMARPATGPIVDDGGPSEPAEQNPPINVDAGVTSVGTAASLTAKVVTTETQEMPELTHPDNRLLSALISLTGHVDQLTSEYRDPNTNQERKAEILQECRAYWDMLRELKAENDKRKGGDVI